MQIHGNLIKIFRQREQMFVNTRQRWCHSVMCVHKHLLSLTDKDGRACRNILIKFPCACPTVISSIFGKSFHFPFLYLMCTVSMFS